MNNSTMCHSSPVYNPGRGALAGLLETMTGAYRQSDSHRGLIESDDTVLAVALADESQVGGGYFDSDIR